MGPEFGGTRRGFFPTKDKLQTSVEIKENLLKELAKSTNIKIIDFKADLKNVLVDWLDDWDNGKVSDKITVQIGQGLAEIVPETDENNSLQVERQITL